MPNGGHNGLSWVSLRCLWWRLDKRSGETPITAGFFSFFFFPGNTSKRLLYNPRQHDVWESIGTVSMLVRARDREHRMEYNETKIKEQSLWLSCFTVGMFTWYQTLDGLKCSNPSQPSQLSWSRVTDCLWCGVGVQREEKMRGGGIKRQSVVRVDRLQLFWPLHRHSWHGKS